MCHFPRGPATRTGGLANRHRAAAMAGSRPVFEIAERDPPTATPETLDAETGGRQKSARGYYVSRVASPRTTIDHLEALIEGRGVAEFKGSWATPSDNLPSPSPVRHARRFRDRRPAWAANCASCGDGLDHGAQGKEGAGGWTHRPSSAFGLTACRQWPFEAVVRAKAILAEWDGARIHILHISSDS